jgi:hypothetical protein
MHVCENLCEYVCWGGKSATFGRPTGSEGLGTCREKGACVFISAHVCMNFGVEAVRLIVIVTLAAVVRLRRIR